MLPMKTGKGGGLSGRGGRGSGGARGGLSSGGGGRGFGRDLDRSTSPQQVEDGSVSSQDDYQVVRNVEKKAGGRQQGLRRPRAVCSGRGRSGQVGREGDWRMYVPTSSSSVVSGAVEDTEGASSPFQMRTDPEVLVGNLSGSDPPMARCSGRGRSGRTRGENCTVTDEQPSAPEQSQVHVGREDDDAGESHGPLASGRRSSGMISEAEPEQRSRKWRYCPSFATMTEMRLYQKSTETLCSKLSFQRVTGEIVRRLSAEKGYETPFRFQAKALGALQEAAEAHLSDIFEDANLLAKHAKRVTMYPKDLKLAMKIGGKV